MAEDLVQECFVEAWRSRAKLSDPAKARAWLHQILRFRWTHYLRDNSRRIRTSSDSDSLGRQPDAAPDHTVQLEQSDDLQQALNQIDDEMKLPLLLVVMEGYTCQEAADLLEVPLGTALSRIHRAKLTLRELLSAGKV